MDSMTASVPTNMEPSNYDEFAMQQSLWFSESLKDLKNLRTQLYSAAEYFELSYTADDQKDAVLETLKDYATKALVNTVDHLGSVTYKVNDLLDEKVEEVSGTELNISCIEQRLRTCQEYINHQGLSEQTLVIRTPRYHKRYILPESEYLDGVNNTKSSYLGFSLDDEDDLYQLKNAVQATMKDIPSLASKGRFPRSSPRPPQRTFSFTASMHKKEQEKRAVSPHRFPLLRTVSLSIKSTSQKPSKLTSLSRPTSPKSSSAGQKRYPSEPRKSLSMRVPTEREGGKDVEHQPSKSKRSLKSLLSRRKSKKDSISMPHSYLDE